MGTYNTIRGELPCIRCGAITPIDAECTYGYTSEMQTLSIGDPYPLAYVPSQSFDIDAYAECASCHLDFGLRITIEDGRIQRIQGEPDTLTHVHDGLLTAELACPECAATGAKDIKLYGASTPGRYRLGDVYARRRTPAETHDRIRGRAYCEADPSDPHIFAVRIALRGEVIESVEVDPHRSDIAGGITLDPWR
jgi:hypothetical protein